MWLLLSAAITFVAGALIAGEFRMDELWSRIVMGIAVLIAASLLAAYGRRRTWRQLLDPGQLDRSLVIDPRPKGPLLKAAEFVSFKAMKASDVAGPVIGWLIWGSFAVLAVVIVVVFGMRLSGL